MKASLVVAILAVPGSALMLAQHCAAMRADLSAALTPPSLNVVIAGAIPEEPPAPQSFVPAIGQNALPAEHAATPTPYQAVRFRAQPRARPPLLRGVPRPRPPIIRQVARWNGHTSH